MKYKTRRYEKKNLNISELSILSTLQIMLKVGNNITKIFSNQILNFGLIGVIFIQ